MRRILALATTLCLAQAVAVLALESGVDDEKVPVEKPESTSAVVYPCRITGRVLDAETGAPIAKAVVKLVEGTGSRFVSRITSSTGAYRFDLAAGAYRYIVTHPHYVMESSGDTPITLREPFVKRIPLAGGLYREVTITSESYLTIDVYMAPRPRRLLLITTSLLRKTEDFDATVRAYIDVLDRTERIEARYIELDSADCRERYGTRLIEPTDWEAVRVALRTVVERENASYILLLGGIAVVPRPQPFLWTEGHVGPLDSDAWYADLDEDLVMDAGLVVSRLPEVGTDSSGIVAALETAIDRHEAGGYRMNETARFSRQCWFPPPVGLGSVCHEDDAMCGSCYATPPYGLCEECSMREELFDVFSTSTYLELTGHGSPELFESNDHELKFSIDYMDRVDFHTHQPLITGHVSCLTGVLWESAPTLSTEFLRAGASGFVARTTQKGTPSHFVTYFEDYLRGTNMSDRYRIGDAMSELMRETVLLRGEREVATTAQLVLYGDPTLRRTWMETMRLYKPSLPLEP